MLKVENRPILWALALSVTLHTAAAAIVTYSSDLNRGAEEGAFEVTLLGARGQAPGIDSVRSGDEAMASEAESGEARRALARLAAARRRPPRQAAEARTANGRLAAASRINAQCDTCQQSAPLPAHAADQPGERRAGDLQVVQPSGGEDHIVKVTYGRSRPAVSKQEEATNRHRNSRSKTFPVTKAGERTTQSRQPSLGSTGQDLRPLCVSCPTPAYPLRARREGWQGDVELFLEIADDGSVRVAEVRRSSGHATLDLAAAEVARRSRFALPPRSRRRGGRMTYRFVLSGDGNERGR